MPSGIQWRIIFLWEENWVLYQDMTKEIKDAILPDCGESSSSEESFLWSLPFPPFLSLQKMDKKKYQSQHEYHTLHWGTIVLAPVNFVKTI